MHLMLTWQSSAANFGLRVFPIDLVGPHVVIFDSRLICLYQILECILQLLLIFFLLHHIIYILNLINKIEDPFPELSVFSSQANWTNLCAAYCT